MKQRKELNCTTVKERAAEAGSEALNTQGKRGGGLGELTFRTLLTPRSQSDFH